MKVLRSEGADFLSDGSNGIPPPLNEDGDQKENMDSI